jgi:hypothetical protein
MHKYVPRKITPFSAVLFTGDNIDEIHDLIGDKLVGYDLTGSSKQLKFASKPGYYHTVYDGTWIIISMDGTVDSMDKERFERFFTIFKDGEFNENEVEDFNDRFDTIVIGRNTMTLSSDRNQISFYAYAVRSDEIQDVINALDPNREYIVFCQKVANGYEGFIEKRVGYE